MASRCSGLPFADPAHSKQVRADGTTAYACLLQNDVNLTSPSPLADELHGYDRRDALRERLPECPSRSTTSSPRPTRPVRRPAVSASNGFLKTPGLPGGCTRDLVHRYYSEQFQINGGKQNRYVTGSDAAGLSMGYYDTTKLPIYNICTTPGAPHYVIADISSRRPSAAPSSIING